MIAPSSLRLSKDCLAADAATRAGVGGAERADVGAFSVVCAGGASPPVSPEQPDTEQTDPRPAYEEHAPTHSFPVSTGLAGFG
jgi:hypothetical protein